MKNQFEEIDRKRKEKIRKLDDELIRIALESLKRKPHQKIHRIQKEQIN